MRIVRIAGATGLVAPWLATAAAAHPGHAGGHGALAHPDPSLVALVLGLGLVAGWLYRRSGSRR